ncbi:7015_t:CDS:2 [Entrophospora sp. SA101]|nr:7015_t:CDS:2 [Entrophospora sp. SA101]
MLTLEMQTTELAFTTEKMTTIEQTTIVTETVEPATKKPFLTYSIRKESNERSIPTLDITISLPWLDRYYANDISIKAIEGALTDNKKELASMKMLSTVNVGPRLLSIFNNGRFEQYLDAVPLTKDEIRDKEISRKIASSMFKLHEIPVPADIESAVPEVWSNIDKWYELSLSQDIVENSSIKRFNLESLKEEVEELKRILEMVNSPIIFGHNDVSFDIGNHFCEWTFNYDSHDPHVAHLDWYPNEDEQLNFLESYLDGLLSASKKQK